MDMATLGKNKCGFREQYARGTRLWWIRECWPDFRDQPELREYHGNEMATFVLLLIYRKRNPSVTPDQKRKRPASLQALIYMVPAPRVELGTY